MFDRGMAVSFNKLNHPPFLLGSKKTAPQSNKISGFGTAAKEHQKQKTSSLLKQANTVGIVGGVSALSTLIFLEKLVYMSSRHGEESIPFVVCSDPSITRQLPSFGSRTAKTERDVGAIIENLRYKRKFLELSGAGCIVMPCHLSHAWYEEISEGCSLPFLHVGECVASELKSAKLKPLEAGCNVRIGLLAPNATLTVDFYQEKLQNQGFEVVLPDKGTNDHIIIPAIEALERRDLKGAQNLLRIAIQILLMRAVNTVIIASDKLQGLLPQDDPLQKKCVDPMDALARSVIRWAKPKAKVHTKT